MRLQSHPCSSAKQRSVWSQFTFLVSTLIAAYTLVACSSGSAVTSSTTLAEGPSVTEVPATSSSAASTDSPTEPAAESDVIVLAGWPVDSTGSPQADIGAEIWSINADGTDMRRLTMNAEHDIDPLLSPDRRQIVFQRSEDVEFNIWTMSVDGSNIRPLAEGVQVNGPLLPSWSPDGRLLAVAGYRKKDTEYREGIYLIDVRTGHVSFVIDTDDIDFAPTWSPDGSLLAFTGVQESDVGFSTTNVWVVAPNGDGLTRLAEGLKWASRPVWSPDGRRLIFASRDIMAIDIDGSEMTTLVDAQFSVSDVKLSPDGRTLAYSLLNTWNDSPEIWVANSDGSSPRRVAHPDVDPDDAVYTSLTDFRWSPDSTRLVFTYDLEPTSADDGNVYLKTLMRVIDITTNEPSRLILQDSPAVVSFWLGSWS